MTAHFCFRFCEGVSTEALWKKPETEWISHKYLRGVEGERDTARSDLRACCPHQPPSSSLAPGGCCSLHVHQPIPIYRPQSRPIFRAGVLHFYIQCAPAHPLSLAHPKAPLSLSIYLRRLLATSSSGPWAKALLLLTVNKLALPAKQIKTNVAMLYALLGITFAPRKPKETLISSFSLFLPLPLFLFLKVSLYLDTCHKPSPHRFLFRKGRKHAIFRHESPETIQLSSYSEFRTWPHNL